MIFTGAMAIIRGNVATDAFYTKSHALSWMLSVLQSYSAKGNDSRIRVSCVSSFSSPVMFGKTTMYRSLAQVEAS